MTTQLNDYDMVLAISQDTINNQFFLLYADGSIDDTIDITYTTSPTELVLNTQIDAPTVEMVLQPASVHQVDFNINCKSGHFSYMDYQKSPEEPQVADTTGWKFTFRVDLTKMTINSTTPTGLKVSSAAQSAIEPYVGDSAFTVDTLFLDFDNVSLSELIVTTDDVKMQPNDPRYPWVLVALQQVIAHLKKDGNPYIIGFHSSSNNPAQTNPQTPALAPTKIQFIANQYNYPSGEHDDSDDGLSSLCYLAMVENHPFPYADNKVPSFSWNQIPNAQTQGRMYVANATFNSGYIHDLVLPVLKRAMGGNTNFSQSGNSWTYNYNYNDGNQHDGHGPVVGSDSGILDIYGKTTIQNYCTFKLDTGKSVSNKLVYSGSGYYYMKLDLYEHPIGIWAHDAWTSTKLPFTFSLTISAGASATLDVNFATSKGSHSSDQWENGVIKFTDALSGLFGGPQITSQLSQLNSQWTSFEGTEFTSFTNAAKQGFKGLSEQLILPAPKTFYYSNIALNSEKDVVLDIGYKD